jgi:FkbM family methyltransferase
LNIGSVYDIGANVGQFAHMIRKFLPEADVFSFEPLQDVCEALKSENAVATSAGGKWHILNTALGDYNGSTVIRRSSVTTDSSMLEMTDYYKAAARKEAVFSDEKISMRRLDDLISEGTLPWMPDVMIKMDVEGFEKEVISGGEQAFRNARVIYTEVTFHNERYKGQVLFDELYGILHDLGFGCSGFYSLAWEPNSGIPAYGDAVFVRK